MFKTDQFHPEFYNGVGSNVYLGGSSYSEAIIIPKLKCMFLTVVRIYITNHPVTPAIVSWEESDSFFEHIHTKNKRAFEYHTISGRHRCFELRVLILMNWESWSGAGSSSFLQTPCCHIPEFCYLFWFCGPPEVMLTQLSDQYLTDSHRKNRSTY